MLEVGNGRLTQEEEEAHMAIWCLLSESDDAIEMQFAVLCYSARVPVR